MRGTKIAINIVDGLVTGEFATRRSNDPKVELPLRLLCAHLLRRLDGEA